MFVCLFVIVYSLVFYLVCYLVYDTQKIQYYQCFAGLKVIPM